MNLKDAIRKGVDNNLIVFDSENFVVPNPMLSLRLVLLMLAVAKLNDIQLTHIAVGEDVFNNEDEQVNINDVHIYTQAELNQGASMQKFFADELGGCYPSILGIQSKSIIVGYGNEPKDVLLGAI